MRSERLASLGRRLANLHADFISTYASQWMERTLDDSAVRRIDIPEMFLCADACLILLDNIFGGLVVYPKRIASRVQEELPFMATYAPLPTLSFPHPNSSITPLPLLTLPFQIFCITPLTSSIMFLSRQRKYYNGPRIKRSLAPRSPRTDPRPIPPSIRRSQTPRSSKRSHRPYKSVRLLRTRTCGSGGVDGCFDFYR